MKVWRLNLPYNCYSLDLTDNRDVREKGVKQLFLNFNILDEKFSVGILLEGQSLAGFRKIKTHRSKSTGDAIRLDNLGERIFSQLTYIVIILGVPIFREYTVKISNNIFVPKDLTKHCTLGPDLVPVWLALRMLPERRPCFWVKLELSMAL